MKNIYNKGKYRDGEWAKHLRPYLKRIGNKRWRRTSSTIAVNEYDAAISEIISPRTKKRIRKLIEVKFRIRSIGDRTYSYKQKYHSLRSAKDAMKRGNVVDAKIIETKSD